MKTLALFFALIVPAFGRIGETPAECKARYGEPVATKEINGNQAITFNKAGMQVIVGFYKGKAAILVIKRLKGTDIDRNKISDTEIEAILKSNSGGGEWIKMNGINVNRIWKCDASKRKAMYGTSDDILTIMTDEFSAHEDEYRASKEKKNLEGF